MFYELVFSDHGWLVYRRERAELRALKAEVSRLRQQREALAREILRLRHDPKALEDLAHRELGYVHPDEYMVLLPDGRKGRKRAGGRNP